MDNSSYWLFYVEQASKIDCQDQLPSFVIVRLCAHLKFQHSRVISSLLVALKYMFITLSESGLEIPNFKFHMISYMFSKENVTLLEYKMLL